MKCAPHHRDPVMVPTRCMDCGRPIKFMARIALCPDCLSDRQAEAERTQRFDAALDRLDRMGEEE